LFNQEVRFGKREQESMWLDVPDDLDLLLCAPVEVGNRTVSFNGNHQRPPACAAALQTTLRRHRQFPLL
jgi:hypothetical protein